MEEGTINTVRISDLPSVRDGIAKGSYVLIDNPIDGEGTYKATVEQLQSVISVDAKVTQSHGVVTISIKDVNGQTIQSFHIPDARVEEGSDTCVITVTDSNGDTTTATVLKSVPIDTTPTEGSSRAITSGAVYDLAQQIANPVLPVNPVTPPTAQGAIWIETT